MPRTVKNILLGLLFCAGLVSCEKEYSIESGNLGPASGGTAVYTFDGAPGVCAYPVINGNYNVGTALNSTNTVILTASVTTAGTYTISTGVVNGVSFTVSSSFSTTGAQIIQLTGSGTPAAAGTFSYTPGTNGCAFSVTFAAASGGGGGSGTAAYTCTSMISTGTYTAGATLGTSNTLVLQVNVTTAGTYTLNTGTADNIGFSGSGTLAVGTQTITLAGSGVPTSAGSVTFSIGTGCSVTIPVASASGGSTDFLNATIAGTATQFNVGLKGVISNAASGPSTLSIDGSLNATASDNLAIDFSNLTGLITTGNYNNGSATNTTKFIEISYTDNAGNLYAPNPASTTAATVNLTTLTATGASGTFSGTLTIFTGTSFGTATKTITAGSFSITF